MAFPASPLSVKVELQNIVSAGAWTDITSYVYDRGDSAIQIVRGRQDEGSGTQPATCNLTLNNRDGRFSPRNPTGPYYGRLGRNTPIRVSVNLGPTRLVADAVDDRANTVDSAGLSITGDIDIRIDARLLNWAKAVTLVGKTAAAPQRSYALDLNADGTLTLYWSADGTNWLTATSTVPLPQTTGRQAVRATLDVNNGAAGRTIAFYTAPTMSGTWTQLGSAVVQAGVTSIFDSTSGVSVGIGAPVGMETYSAKILQGIGGTERANPDWTTATDGATSIVDAAGNTWTLGGASITNKRYRFHGEVSAWPQSWDVSGKDVWVPASASGILRRVAQASDPLKSAYERFVVRGTTTAYGYWPLEDSEGSTTMASGLTGGTPMTIAGAPEFATSSTFASANPLPVLAGASFSAPIASHASTGTSYTHFLLSIPAGGDGAATACMLRLYTTGTAARWDLLYVPGGIGGWTLKAYDSVGTEILSSGIGVAINGNPVSIILKLVQDGADIDWELASNGYIEGTSGLGFMAGTLAGRTVGVSTYVQINPDRALSESVVGHLTVYAAEPYVYGQLQSLRGWIGELAGRRVERLCGEEGIAFTAYGDLDESRAMGYQRPAALLDLLSECEVADIGQVVECRDSLGLGFRTRDSRQYQGAALAMAYGDLAELVPVEDDQATRNDVTVSRVVGSSARITVDTGPLSTQPPPNGVGRYPETIDVNLAADSQIGNHAQWRATEGTIDEARYPDISVRLEAPAFSASSALTDQALSVDHGDLISVSSPPAWLPPDQIRQHTIGQSETLGQYEYGISFVCTPTIPAGSTTVYDHASARYAAGTSTLTSGITSTATGAAAISITTAAGSPLWTTNAADFPMNIRMGGEVITLSAISGASSPQSATVSARSVNGVVKSHSAGVAIDIDGPVYYSF